MRLIDADEMLLNESEAYMKVQTSKTISAMTRDINQVVHMKIQMLIADTPTVDAVPVVRCKECKYKRKLRGNDNLIYCNAMCIDMALDAFCSLGEQEETGV